MRPGFCGSLRLEAHFAKAVRSDLALQQVKDLGFLELRSRLDSRPEPIGVVVPRAHGLAGEARRRREQQQRQREKAQHPHQ